jgi:hypothetical protein
MPLATITVSLYPNVPMLPGVPQLVRSPLFPPSPAPTLGTAQQDALGSGSAQQNLWGIFDSSFNPVLQPDSFLDFDWRSDYRISNFPVQAGGFATYNKVKLPEEISLRMAFGQDLTARANFLSTLSSLSAGLDLYTISTPEVSYLNCNIQRCEVTRRGKEGAFFLTEVDVYFIQIIQVTAQYSSTAANTQNAQQAVSQPPVNQGAVQPQTPAPINNFPITGLSQPFVLGTPTSSLYQSLGPLNPP